MPLLVVATGFIIYLPYIRLLFFALAGISEADRRVTIHLPFCEWHRNHWRWRSWPLAGILILSLGLIGVGIFIGTQVDPKNQTAILMVVIGVLGLLLRWILGFILQFTVIRITDLAGTALTLTGVSESFCDAVDEHRGEKPESSSEPFETSDYDERLRRRREGRF